MPKLNRVDEEDSGRSGDGNSFVPISPFTYHVSSGKIRLILVRNGEPCDRLNPAWRFKAFPDYRRYLLSDLNQPVKVVDRIKPADSFKNDSPLTAVGSVCAQLVGRAIGIRELQIHAVFCSPSLRCVQSCNSLLAATPQKLRPQICVEPGLFEPLSFYWQEGLPQFLSVEELKNHGYPVDLQYQPLISVQRLKDGLYKEKTAADTSNRLKEVSDMILDLCNGHSDGAVLVVTHATSIDGIVRHIQERHDFPHDSNDLVRMGLAYPFCSTVVLERDVRQSIGKKKNKWDLNLDVIPHISLPHLTTQVQVPHFA